MDSKSLLVRHKIKVTIPRIIILDIFGDNRKLLTVDDVFEKVQYSISKATVYNTINLLAQNMILKRLKFNNLENAFYTIDADAIYFRCDNCASVFKFSVNSLKKINFDNFNINGLNGYFNGFCSKCVKKMHN